MFGNSGLGALNVMIFAKYKEFKQDCLWKDFAL